MHSFLYLLPLRETAKNLHSQGKTGERLTNFDEITCYEFPESLDNNLFSLMQLGEHIYGEENGEDEKL